ncbi:MAG: hypothetical protein Q6L60_00940 [Thermostichus sp. HHBFW_bins_43]
MAWQQVGSGIWHTHLGRWAPQWWLGWSPERGFQLYRQEAPFSAEPALRIRYQKQDQWLDVFLGEAEEHPQRRRSLLDPTARVALHYLPEDLPQIQSLKCPHECIPPQLWQRLTQQCS